MRRDVKGELKTPVRQRGDGARKRAAKPIRFPPLTWREATVSMSQGGGWCFTIPVVVSANRLWRGGKGRTFKCKQARIDTHEALERFGHVTPLSGPVSVEILWYRDKKCGDLDNKCKSTLDLLKTIAFADDAQVEEIYMRRSDDKTEQPRIVVWVTWARPAEA